MLLVLCFVIIRTILTSGTFIFSICELFDYVIGVVNYETEISICGKSLQGELWGWTCFYVAVISVGFGSAYYHLGPNDNGLVCDRLPVS